MRIGLLHYTAPPIVGGVEATIGFQARFLERAGHAPVLLAGDGGPADPGVELRRIPGFHSRHPEVLSVKAELDRGRSGDAFQRLRSALGGSLREAVADLEAVIVHNALSLHKNLALTAAIWEVASPDKHWIAWHHDLAWDRPDYADELHPGEPWDLLRRPLPGAVHVAVSEAVRARAQRVFGLAADAIRVIPPGVDPPTFGRWTARTRDIVERFGLSAADPLLLLPSRLTRRKNIEFAVRVMSELRRLAQDPRLLVTGPPGPHNPANQAYLEELLALVRDSGLEGSVHWLYLLDPERPHAIDDDTLSDLFRLCDALLFPSLDEGFGIPVLEAGLARLPVFCSDLAPFRESGGDDVTLFPLDADPAAVAATIHRRLHADPAFRLSRRVRREYGWADLLTQRLLPILERSPDG